MSFIWKPCDIVGSSGTGLLSNGIKWLTQGWREPATEVSHIAHCVKGGDDNTAILHDALAKHWRGTPAEIYGGNGPLSVYRPLNLSQYQEAIILGESELEYNRLKGRSYNYSWGYIGLAGLDMLLGERYFFRRMVATRLPVCSTSTSRKWLKAGLSFGTDADAVSPDVLFDWMQANQWAYTCVRPFTKLEKRSEEAAK